MAERPISQIVDKQVRNLSGATQDIKEGIAAVTESPTAKAAKNLGKAKTNYVKSIDDGKMERGLLSVSTEDWKSATTAKVDRIATGVEEARDKITKFHEQRQPYQERLSKQIADMPSLTLEQNIQRSAAQQRGMSKFEFDKSR